MNEDEIKIDSDSSSINLKDGEDVVIKGKDNKIEIEGEKKNIIIKGKENIIKIKEKADFFSKFLKEKKWFIFIGLLLVVLILGIWIRTLNMPLLVDSTTGENIPLALDPYYFLRIAETMIKQGGLPEYDSMRKPFNMGWTNEILPNVLVWMYNLGNIFGNYSIGYIDIISPVVFFALGLIVFFFLIYLLTNSKSTALISSIFLAFIPTYLYRTMAGFSDHESIGMFAFFLALLGYTYALKKLDKKGNEEEYEKRNKKRINFIFKSMFLGALIGFLTVFTIKSWGGIANFLFLIIPLSFGIFWLIKTKNIENFKRNKKEFLGLLIFYISYFVFTILFGLVLGYPVDSIIGRAILSTTSILNGFIFLFIISDFFIIKNINRIPVKNAKKYRLLFSLVGVILLGILFLILLGKNPVSMFLDIIGRLLHPFGEGRVGLTVAENAQPSLNNWISQIGKIFFWISILGMFFVGKNISKGIFQKKNRIIFIFFWILLFSGIIFSRISSDSLLNGTNLISRLFYFGSIILFLIISIRIYLKDKIEIKPEMIIIFSWMLFMLIGARGAIRLFFVITPFICFMGSYAITNLFYYTKENKDEMMKTILIISFGILVISSLFSMNNFIASTSYQAKNTGPSANYQWQQAMNWVRENTSENAVFIHWWDYGYWIEYLGKRATIADGGHFQGGFRDHMIGRYVLTTTKPETALSFMKTNNISYLLIDSTDLGKYGAYSKIGSDGKDNNYDRFSSIPIGTYDSSQIYETSNETRMIYNFGMGVDEDIIYKEDEKDIFIPGPTYNEKGNPSYKSAIGGIILTIKTNSSSLEQPQGIYFYRGEQYEIPIRYLYIKGQMTDFGKGLDATISIIPKLNQDGQNTGIDNIGSMIYLSPKTSKSLFAQLYLLNDSLNRYPTLELVHSEEDYIVKELKNQGALTREFVYYRGLRGPIKIWKVNYREDIIEREEFLRRDGEYAEFDDLEFSKKNESI
jgi:asparagine N-glycosylation enzyme membrane subunit Stt3